jgi:hypothetical protein
MSESTPDPIKREARNLPEHQMTSAPAEVLTEELLGEILVYCRDTANPTHEDIRVTFKISAEVWADWVDNIPGFEAEVARWCLKGLDELVQATRADGLNGDQKAREFLLKHRHKGFKQDEAAQEENLPRATDITRRFL